jgi:capsular polysaccharide biosynthesis protein
VELNEAARRIFLQHWWLIAIAVLIGAAIGAVVAGGSSGYTASTRLVINANDPTARAESTAIADTARAIVTSPSLVQRALTAAGASTRNVEKFAANDISVSALGSSGVLEMSVTASSPTVAASVSNALARELIATRLQISNGRADAAQTKLTKQITSLNRGIAQLDATIAVLGRQSVSTRGTHASNPQTQLDNSTQERDLLTQQRGILEAEQASLLTTSATGPSPSIISPATAAGAGAVGASYSSDAILGGLLGLIVGIGIAALLEGVRPTLTDGEAVSRELGTPHLGTLSFDSGAEPGLLSGAAAVTHQLKEAARRARVANVDLLGSSSTSHLALFAEWLNVEVEGSTVDPPRNGATPRGASGRSRKLSIRPFGPQDVADGNDTGLVVITPTVVKKTDLAGVSQFVRSTRSPLLGVITYKPSQHTWTGWLPERHTDEKNAEAITQT